MVVDTTFLEKLLSAEGAAWAEFLYNIPQAQNLGFLAEEVATRLLRTGHSWQGEGW